MPSAEVQTSVLTKNTQSTVLLYDASKQMVSRGMRIKRFPPPAPGIVEEQARE